MVVSCSAFGCRNRQNDLDEKGNKLSFHRFPADDVVRKMWILAVRRQNFIPKQHSFICSEHFTEDQFDRTHASGRVRLREKSVPTIFNIKGKHKKEKLVKTVDVNTRETNTDSVKNRAEKTSTGNSFSSVPVPAISVSLEDGVTVSEESTAKVTDQPNSLLRHALLKGLPKIAPKLVPESSAVDTSHINILNDFRHIRKSSIPPDTTDNTMSISVVKPQTNPTNITSLPTLNMLLSPTSNINIQTNMTTPVTNVTVQSLNSIVSRPCAINNTTTISEANIQNKPKRKLKTQKYEEKIKEYRREIKVLKQKNRRQKAKIEKLQGIIRTFKDYYFSDVEELSEDISENEIYEELRKHQEKNDYYCD